MKLKKQVRRTLAKANRYVGRHLGVQLARVPRDGTLEMELERLIAGFEIRSVIDVGAHRGGFGRRLRSIIGFDGRIVSFEPSPEAFDSLLAEVSTDHDWYAWNLALGATDGVGRLTTYRSDQFNSLLPLGEFANVYAPWLSSLRSASVEVRRLDSVWPSLECETRTTMLKIDTQGYDLQVLEGMGTLLHEIPCVLTEVPVQPLYEGSPATHAVIKFMDDRGFELSGAFPIHRYAEGLRVIEFDCTFVNRRRFDDPESPAAELTSEA